jgi:tRNA threonylcarbamoyladenosine biosynthesis protein TsaB
MTKFSTILAIDTAMNGCGVGVLKNGVGFSEVRPMMQGQGEHLMPLVQEVMKRAGAAFEEVQAVVTTCGPGAFTGLRIGLSAAKSIALARDIPLFGITTLQALALQYAEENKNAVPIAVVIETKREDFYFQIFDGAGKAIGEASALSAAKAAEAIDGHKAVTIGDGVERLSKSVKLANISEKYTLSDPRAMAAWLAAGKSNIFSENPEPLYLRAPDVTQPKKPQRAGA